MKKICMIAFGDVRWQNNGYYIRTLMLAKKLQNEGNEVVLYHLLSQKHQEELYQGIKLRSLVSNHQHTGKISGFITKILSFDPFKIIFSQIQGYRSMLPKKSELLSFDQYYIEGCLLLHAFYFLKKHGAEIILDSHCINKDFAVKMFKQNRIKGGLRIILWHFLENKIFNNVSKIITVSDEEARFIQLHYKIAPDKITVIANQVDSPDPQKYREQALHLRTFYSPQNQKIACFIGDLGALHNREAALYIKNNLSVTLPTVMFIIIGNNPEKLSDTCNVKFTGFVPAIDPFIIMADVCLCPLIFGSGTKTKMLDFLKYQKPIITTSIGAEGLNIPNNGKVVIIDRKFFPKVIQTNLL